MTTPDKTLRFRLRRNTPAAEAPDTDGQDAPEAGPQEDAQPPFSLGRQPRETDPQDAASRPAQPDRPAPPEDDVEDSPADKTQAALDAIRAEGLTAHQLRRAMRLAKKHGLRPVSAFEAVLLLRARGIDPFARSTMMDIVADDADAPRQATPAQAAPTGRALAPRPDPAVPVRTDAANPMDEARARMARLAEERATELRRVQSDIAARRRKRLALLGARLLVFVMMPTFIAGWYFYVIATPMYATESQFIIQQANGQGRGAGDLAGMLPSAGGMGLGGQSEAASVQSFLQSRPAMLRLDAEEGFRAHFQQDHIDQIRRLPPDATTEATFRTYQRHVKIGYDPTVGVIRMEVIAATPEDSARFAGALIRYAEEHVDMMTQRLRDSQMQEARRSLEDAQQSLIAARQAQAELREQSRVFSGQVEVSLMSQRIGALEAELSQTRLSLADLRANLRPNPARVEPLERREAALRAQIAELRAAMTNVAPDAASLARTQSQLISTEAEVQTREMMRAQAMQQLDSARMEMSRQVRYLALSVAPVASDEPAYPRRTEYTALAFLIFLGAYLFVSITGSVLREQVSG